MKIWLSSGPPENWMVAIQEGGVWGVDPKPTLKKRWDKLSEGDLVAFYVSSPVSRVVGLGRVKSKNKEDIPLWPAEKQAGRAKWVYRFRFDILQCLDENLWKTKGIPIGDLRISRSAGLNLVREKSVAVAFLQRADVEWGTDLTKLLAPKAAKPAKELNPHEEIKSMIYDIGVWQGWISEKEYKVDNERLDVAWIKRGVKGARPKVAFEVQFEKTNLDRALRKLKDANDMWNTKPALVSPTELRSEIDHLLGGAYHEIAEEIKILTPDDIKELYEAEKKLSALKREKTLIDILS